MTSKIFKSIFMTALAILLSAILIFFAFTYNHYEKRIVAELERDFEYISTGISTYGTDYLESVSADGVRIVLTSFDGTVLYDSAPNDNQALSCTSVLDDGSTLVVSTAESPLVSVLMDMLGTALILFAIAVLLAFLVANSLSRSIVKPINNINLDSPNESVVYEELRPMISRLSQQRYKLSLQLAKLRIKEEEFSSIMANMGEGIMVINSKTVILSCNDAAKRIFGISGDLPSSILSVNNSESFRGAIVKALKGEVAYDVIRTGEKVYSITVSPVRQDSLVEGAIVLVIDDTEKDERERLRREFTSNVSHELKTPLTAISGFAELIRSGITSTEDAVHFADNIHKEAARLIVLVGDIIQLTRLDGSEMPYDDEPVRLDELVKETAARLEGVAASKDISISCDTERVRMPGNSKIVEEIIYNLADNAIKYNKPGGFVKLRAFLDGNEAVLTVTDNGIGIPQDKQDRVFERFFRVEKSHSKNIGGTGLGLSIVKHSAAYHKARIILNSEEGQGTEIKVCFPSKI